VGDPPQTTMNWLALSFLFATWTSPAASTRITDISGISQRTPMLGQTVNLTALVTAKVWINFRIFFFAHLYASYRVNLVSTFLATL
jgi:hypothetical protein